MDLAMILVVLWGIMIQDLVNATYIAIDTMTAAVITITHAEHVMVLAAAQCTI
ncbi:hypothetical protein HOLleu_11735 [Holothuria leucospilota]|uniref:Uncharacterized protein n=1 Tax=Holothuria leucospilota TaxID=206669 RepID=A0A9Q1CG18_HOLLE|nr:hypothetical protein HOLleu_11735 [Holothuria leucospilota]